MRHRVLGRSGVRVSELWLGGHEYKRWLPRESNMEVFLKTQPQRKKLIERALDAGVNFFDTTHAEEAESLGLAQNYLSIQTRMGCTELYVSLRSRALKHVTF